MDRQLWERHVQPVWARNAVRRDEHGGLVVENMWLDETEYAEPDSRPAVNLLQWIQYQLDNCKTVAEVISNDTKIRIESPPASAKSLARIHT